jgi:ribonuclease R
VHIADVAHYVEPGSRIDLEARLRGTSVYFPDRAVPMLPAELSTDLCSLRPQVDRLVMSCVMEVSAGGDVVRYEIVPGIICSAQRMTYTAVNAILSGDRYTRSQYGSLAPHFERMLELEQILNKKRVHRGAIDFDLPEPEISFDEFGLMRSIVKSERNVAHRIIEEFMLLANETVAGHLEQLGVPSVYRIHEKPDAKKVAEFEEIAATFGYSLGVGALPIKRVRERISGRVRTIELPVEHDFHITPRQYQKLAAKLEGKPEERILSYLMLRSLKQARYSAENAGHFALAASTYTHFTSPIRRYPDLLVHRILKYVLRENSTRVRSDGSSQAHAASSPAVSGPYAHRRRVNAKNATSDSREPGRAVVASLKARSSRREELPQHLPQTEGPMSFEELDMLCRESSDAERRADDAERELMDWKKIRFMEARIGEEFDALILHVTKAGFFIELTDLFIDGFVPLAVLEDDRYMLRESEHALVGDRTKKRYRVGDRLVVIVDRIDPVRHKINFAPVADASETKAQHRGRQGRGTR